MKKLIVLFLSMTLLLCACTSQTDNNSQAQSSEGSEESVNSISLPNVADVDSSNASSTMLEDESSNEDNTSNTISKDDTSSEESSSSTSESYDENATVIVTYLEKELELADEHKAFLEGLLSSDGWIEGTPDCAHDFTINIGERTYYYHSECGTVKFDGKSSQLVDSDKSNLNTMLFAFVEATQNN